MGKTIDNDGLARMIRAAREIVQISGTAHQAELLDLGIAAAALAEIGSTKDDNAARRTRTAQLSINAFLNATDEDEDVLVSACRDIVRFVLQRIMEEANV